MLKKIALSFMLLGFVALAGAQEEDLLKMLDSAGAGSKVKNFTYATFKATRLINQHTVEVLGKKSLDFRIFHRFGSLNSGPQNGYGIYQTATIRLTLEYCHDGRFMFGVGTTSLNLTADGFLKYKILRQSNFMPVTVTAFTGIYHTFMASPRYNDVQKYNTPSDRLSYVSELMVARKFGSALSLQASAAYVHTNMVDSIKDPNDQVALGGLMRVKLSKRQALTAEYFHVLNPMQSIKTYDSFGLGYEVETGGHVFSVFLTNSFGSCENQFISYTTSSWANGGMRIGFNITRVFGFGH